MGCFQKTSRFEFPKRAGEVPNDPPRRLPTLTGYQLEFWARSGMSAQLGMHSTVSIEDKIVWTRIARAIDEWKTTADVGASSYGRRVELFSTAVELHKRAVKAHGCRAFPGAEMQRRVLRLLLWATKQHVRSPRVTLLQSDFGSACTWSNLRDGERRAGAFFAFLGVPTTEFDYLLGRFSSVRSARRGALAAAGRASRFGNADRLALALRHVVTVGPQSSLQFDFGAAGAVVCRELTPALRDLLEVLKAEPDAECRFPSLAEAHEMELGVRKQWGDPPSGADFADPVVLALDGTVTPIFGVSDLAEQRLYAYRNKYHAFNHVLMFDLYGRVCAYSICATGTMHDARLAAPLIEAQQSLVTNPHRLGAVVDSGFVGIATNGSGGKPAIFRPLMTEAIPADPTRAKLCRAFSAYITTRRQPNEWGNGALKRSFPRTGVPVQLSQREDYRVVLEVAIHLNNFRTRRIGFNQLQTTFRRHVNENFRAQLLASKQLGGSAGLQLYFELAQTTIEAELAALPQVVEVDE